MGRVNGVTEPVHFLHHSSMPGNENGLIVVMMLLLVKKIVYRVTINGNLAIIVKISKSFRLKAVTSPDG